MTRNWMIYASPVAFAAGLLLVHCSSSSSTTSEDAGMDGSAGSGSGTTKGSGSGTTKGSGSGTTKGSGSGSMTGSGSAFNAAAGDMGSECVPPAGGSTCTPGTISCGSGSGVSVPANQCCHTSTGWETQTGGATCSGNLLTCNEAADCTGNKICCLLVTDTAGDGTTSCQDGPTCPPGSNIASAQICRSNNECESGKCSLYTCTAAPGVFIEACEIPGGLLGSTCSLYTPGSGSGSSMGSGSGSSMGSGSGSSMGSGSGSTMGSGSGSTAGSGSGSTAGSGSGSTAGSGSGSTGSGSGSGSHSGSGSGSHSGS